MMPNATLILLNTANNEGIYLRNRSRAGVPEGKFRVARDVPLERCGPLLFWATHDASLWDAATSGI